MPFTVTMPKLSPTMESGQIIKWHKKEGDLVAEGDLLIEVATDKATVEYNALDEGVLRKIVVQEGSDADVNAPIAVMTESADESIEGYEPEAVVVAEAPDIGGAPLESKEETPVKESAQTSAKGGAAMAEPVFEPMPPLENYQFEYPTGMLNERILASPAAKVLAKENHIDLSTIKGSGPDGRIVLRDLEGVSGGKVAFHSRALPQDAPGSYDELPMSPMRKMIAKRLQESKSFIPHFYVNESIVVDSLVEVRDQLKEMGIKITYNDLIIRATALALKEHPTINSGYDNQKGVIVQYKTVDVAVAVSVDGGLITPIIRHTNFKNVTQISSEVKQLVGLAKKQKLKPHQFQGGSFTISNLGMFGIDSFSAIINSPQAAILAIGGINDQPVVKDGQVVAAKVLKVTLSADHRVIDGAEGAHFLVTLKRYLQNPAVLLV